MSSLYFIYRTHIAFIRVEKFWKNLGYSPITIEEANGRASGVWILAGQSSFKFSLLDQFHQAVTNKVEVSNKVWACLAIYASPTPLLDSL